MAIKLEIVILAAGLGKRMQSSKPKVLHCLGGKPLIEHVISTSLILSPKTIHVVHGHGGDQVKACMAKYTNLNWIYQQEQLGTGHAVKSALQYVSNDSQVLVLYGDVPLIQADTLNKLLNKADSTSLSLLVRTMRDPAGLGRIVRDNQRNIIAIVEEKDASKEQKKIQEIFTGILSAPADLLQAWLNQVTNDNAQREFYLPDVTRLAIAEGKTVNCVEAMTEEQIAGVNDKQQLALLERYYQYQRAQQLMQQGVTLSDPNRIDIRGDVTLGQDVSMDINVILEGTVNIGSDVTIGANTVIRNSTIHMGCIIKENCVIEDSIIAEECIIGPFARIRPGTKLAENVRVGNFVEIKKTKIGTSSKVNHLTYLGDADIGANVNIGAGTISCNYDGVNKHQTIIGDDAFVGSGTQLIAPVKVGAGATIGAGSTISSLAPKDKLTLSRAPQKTIDNWKRPQKIKEGE